MIRILTTRDLRRLVYCFHEWRSSLNNHTGMNTRHRNIRSTEYGFNVARIVHVVNYLQRINTITLKYNRAQRQHHTYGGPKSTRIHTLMKNTVLH